MLLRLVRLLRRLRSRRAFGFVLVASLLAIAVLGNALCFYTFERSVKPDIGFGDACWYSAVSIATIGYGDYAASTPGGRIGTVVFVILFGLSSFSLFFGMGIDAVAEAMSNASRGLGRAMVKDHILIVHYPSEQRIRQLITEIRSDPEHGDCEIVIISADIEELPFRLHDVVFVRGSSHDVQTYARAGIEHCRMAIVLSPDYADRTSDAIVAAAVSVIDRIKSEVYVVAECLDAKHLPLFEACHCDSVVLGMTIAGNLLVQEVHDPGIAQLIDVLTSNRRGTTLFSVPVEDTGLAYTELAKRLLDQAINVMAINRADESITTLPGLVSQPGDRIIYAAARRLDWRGLRNRAGMV